MVLFQGYFEITVTKYIVEALTTKFLICIMCLFRDQHFIFVLFTRYIFKKQCKSFIFKHTILSKWSIKENYKISNKYMCLISNYETLNSYYVLRAHTSNIWWQILGKELLTEYTLCACVKWKASPPNMASGSLSESKWIFNTKIYKLKILISIFRNRLHNLNWSIHLIVISSWKINLLTVCNAIKNLSWVRLN